MNNLAVKADMRPWVNAIEDLKGRAVTAQVRAINRSTATARTAMTRLVSADMQLKSATVRDRIVVKEATKVSLTASLTASLKRVPIYDFSAKGPYPSRGKGRGVTAKTATRRYPHAFIAQMKSGHSGVFQRKGSSRLPIRELMGPSVGEVFGKHRAEGVRVAEEALFKNMKHEMEFALTQMAQKKG